MEEQGNGMPPANREESGFQTGNLNDFNNVIDNSFDDVLEDQNCPSEENEDSTQLEIPSITTILENPDEFDAGISGILNVFGYENSSPSANEKDALPLNTLSNFLIVQNEQEEIENESELKVQNEEETKYEEEINDQSTGHRKSRELVHQSLSLPYFKLNRPDFHEFTSNAARNLEVSNTVEYQATEDPQNLVIAQSSSNSATSGPSTSTVSQNAENSTATDDDKQDDIVFVWEGPQITEIPSRKQPSCSKTMKDAPPKQPSCSKTMKDNNGFQRENYMKNLKDQMQKKKEAAFDKNKKMEQADEEIYISDGENFDAVLDSDESSPLSFEVENIFPNPNQSGMETVVTEQSPLKNEEKVQEDSDGEMEEIVVTVQRSASVEEEIHEGISNDPESFILAPPYSPSLPSFQPDGGFVAQSGSDSSNSCNVVYDGEPTVFRNPDAKPDEPGFLKSYLKASTSGQRNPDAKPDEPGFLKSYLKASTSGQSSQGSAELYLDASQALDDVSTICSGRFIGVDDERPWTPTANCEITRKRKADEEASKDENNYNEDVDEQEFVPRVKKCKPLLADSDDDDNTIVSITPESPQNKVGESIFTPEHGEASPQNQVGENIFMSDLAEVSPQNEVGENISNKSKVNEFFDSEAVLSEEEIIISSDEYDGDESDDEDEQKLIVNDIPENEGELKEQVGEIHRKHEDDDDAKLVKRLKQDFLPEGELHTDGSGRQKKFHWKVDDAETVQSEIVSESDADDMIESSIQQDKIKWKQESSLIQKDIETSDGEYKEKAASAKKLPVNIIGRAQCSKTTVGAKRNGYVGKGKPPFASWWRYGSLIRGSQRTLSEAGTSSPQAVRPRGAIIHRVKSSVPKSSARQNSALFQPVTQPKPESSQDSQDSD